jgi:hypothetical protein
MTQEMPRECLKEAISNVMEIMYFLPVQFLDRPQALDGWFSGQGCILEALVEFKGPRSGMISLLVPGSGLDEMSCNILGFEENEVNEEHLRDILKETINMMAGRMLSLLDKEGDFTLGIPRFAGEWNERKAVGEKPASELLLFDTGRHHLAASFALS